MTLDIDDGWPCREAARLRTHRGAIQQAILKGRQPLALNLERLIRTPIPHAWDAEKRMFGFR